MKASRVWQEVLTLRDWEQDEVSYRVLSLLPKTSREMSGNRTCSGVGLRLLKNGVPVL